MCDVVPRADAFVLGSIRKVAYLIVTAREHLGDIFDRLDRR